jgi:23S rRNA (adenine2503-C2)-methyltransferase
LKAKLNLIPYNTVEGLPFHSPDPERVLAFEQYLWSRRITAVVRKSKGRDILAACGQLKAASHENIQLRVMPAVRKSS